MIFSVVAMLAILVVVVFFIVVVSAGKKQKIEGGDDVIKTVYNYLVLFATLMMVIGGGIGIFMSAADIAFPEPHFQTFQEFKDSQIQKPEGGVNVSTPKVSDAELRAKYNDIVNENRNRNVNRAKNTLIKSFGWVIIPMPVFLFFQRRISKKDQSEV